MSGRKRKDLIRSGLGDREVGRVYLVTSRLEDHRKILVVLVGCEGCALVF